MCVQSQQVTLFDLLEPSTPSSVAFPASHGASQGSSAEQTTPGTCGLSTTALSAACAHGGSSEKTCPVCCLEVPTQSSPIWKRRATPAGRLYWVLTTSAPRTDASGFSSSPSWPTPTRCGNYNRKGLSATSGDGLATAVQMWPTPQTADCKSPSVGWEAAAERHAAKGVHKQMGLRDLVPRLEVWPTPCAHEARLGYQHRHPDAKGSQISLTTEVMDAEGLAPQRGQPDQDSHSIRGKSRARLNPRWVAQLMGFPADWLDGVQVPSKALATRSSRKSRKQSGGQ